MPTRFRSILKAAGALARNVAARGAADLIAAAPLGAVEAEGRKLRTLLAVIAWALVAADVLLAVIAAGVWFRRFF